MKKILSNYRYYVITILLAVGCGLIMSVPSENLMGTWWFIVFFTTKVAGAAVLLKLIDLMRVWLDNGKIPELYDVFNENY